MQSRGMLLLGGLPLLAYPFVFLAGAMSLGGVWTGHEPTLLVIVARSFLIGSMAYPLVYVPCAIAAVIIARKQEALAQKVSAVPVVFLLALAVLFVAWIQLDQ
jgi:hypothetical protein